MAERILERSGCSPDEKHVAFGLDSVLYVVDLASGATVARWDAPLGERGMNVHWSPDGRELSVGGYRDSVLGMWIYDLNSKKGWKILDAPGTRGVWSPDGRRMALQVRVGQYWELWTSDLDPTTPTWRALGPGRTVDEHLKGRLASATRAIQANPEHPRHYTRRARAYRDLQDYDKALADYARVLEIRPGHGGAYWGRAVVYEQLGQPEATVSDYKESIHKFPNHYILHQRLAWLYVTGPEAVRDPDAALPLAERIVTLCTSSGHQNVQGVVYYRLRRFEDARDTLHKAGPDVRGLFALAMTYHQLGQADKAEEHYNRAI